MTVALDPVCGRCGHSPQALAMHKYTADRQPGRKRDCDVAKFNDAKSSLYARDLPIGAPEAKRSG
jgi:hypothetical protein